MYKICCLLSTCLTGHPIADLLTHEGECQLYNLRLLLGYLSLGGLSRSSCCDETCFSVQIVDETFGNVAWKHYPAQKQATGAQSRLSISLH